MQIPVSLDDWSLDLVRELVRTLDGEPSWLDFKEFLSAPGSERASNKDSIRRTAAGMANAGGGFILFGVGDAQKYPDPEQRLCGIALNSENRKHFNEKLSGIFPSLVGFDFKPLPVTDGNGVLVVHMPTSSLRPHMLWDEGYFPKRGEGGSAGKMSVEEVREQMLSGEERRRRAVLFQLKVAQFHQIADDMFMNNRQLHITYDRFDTASYDALLPDITPLLPSDALLVQLMRISATANRINTMLNLACLPSGTGAPAGLYNEQPARDDARTLARECGEVLKRLGEVLGPLPFDV